MDTFTQHEVTVALIAAIATIITGYLTYRVGRYQISKKTEVDAKTAVDARWTQLCDQQQNRIDQLNNSVGAMYKLQDELQKQIATGVVDRLDMHEQLQILESQAIEREKSYRALEAKAAGCHNRITELEKENVLLKARVKALEPMADRVAQLEAENTELKGQIMQLKERIRVLEAENNCLRNK